MTTSFGTKNGTGAGQDSGKAQVGYAVVGLGHIAQIAVLPAFAHAEMRLEGFQKDRRPDIAQEIYRPPVRKPKLVEVEAPTK